MSSRPPLRVASSAERSLCGSLIEFPADIGVVQQIVGPGALEDPQCCLVYQTLVDMHEAGDEITFLTVGERIERNGRLAECSLKDLNDMIEEGFRGQAQSSARIIARHYERTRLIRMFNRGIEWAENSRDPDEILEMMVEHAKSIAAHKAAKVSALLSVEQLAAAESAQTWAVKGVVQSNSVGMLFGASGSFKSFIALDFALHVAYGMPWLGRKTRKGVPVYLAAEGGTGLMKRIKAWHIARNMDWRQCPMRVVIQPMQFGADAKVLRDAIDAAGIVPTDIIIDTMSQTMVGEENSSTEVSRYLAALGSDLRAPYGATVVVVHHVGHNATERPRGSSAMIANLDWVLGCFRDDKEMLATVEAVKIKDGAINGPWTFRLDAITLGTDEDGDEISSLRATHLSDPTEILNAAMASAGTNGPPSLIRLLDAIPDGGGPDDEVRDRFYRSMSDADQDAKRQAFNRAMRRAKGQGLVMQEGQWIMKMGVTQRRDTA